MRYFIDNIKTYANVNKKGRALQIYVQQFDRHLIADECSLDALKCDIEHQIKVMNEKYPRSRPVRLEVYENAKGGQWTILVEHDSDITKIGRPVNGGVTNTSTTKGMGYYTLEDKIDQFAKIGQ